jgi:hypothetical protein
MWDLAVSNLHTFAVGIEHYTVYSLGCDSGKLSDALGGCPNGGKQAHHVICCACKDHALVKAGGNVSSDRTIPKYRHRSD